MNYFEQRVEEFKSMRHVSKIWFQPGMTLEEACKAVRTIPIDAEYGIENPTQPEQRGWENFSRGDTFIQIRMRELFEGYEVAHEDPYFIGLMGQGGFERDFLLWHDAQLREELLWPLFSLEGTQEVSFANREKYGSGWAAPLIALEKEGLIDRDRLLDEILKALNRGFPAYRVRWFTQHYEDFNPTEAETTARQHLLIAAMGSGVASTTTFGVKQLSRLSQLDEDGFVAAAAHALGGPKSTAVTALKMLDKIAARRDDLAAGVADAAATGLYHSHDEVVRRSAALLRDLGKSELIDDARETLSPAMALELLGHQETDETPTVEAEHIEAQPVAPWTDEDALFHTRELLASNDAVAFTQLVAWLAETGPRAVEILKPAVPKQDSSHFRIDARWLLLQCSHSPAEVEATNASWLPRDTRRESLLRVVAIVHGRAPTRTLLSTPTDTFGRVDNAEFARRLATYADPEDIWQDDAMLAHLRLVDYQEDTTGLAPVQGVQAGCHSFLWSAPQDRCTECIESRMWVRTKEGWLNQNAEHDDELPYLISSPFNATHSPAECAIMAPSCLDVYTYDLERDLDSGLSTFPDRQDPEILEVLRWHPGAWSPHTARFLGKAMANVDPEMRTIAAELVATKLAAAVGAEVAAQQWAQIDDIILGRWAASLTDAATLNPVFVHDLLTLLLPQLDRKARDVGKLIELLRNVRLQTGQRDVAKQLREWLQTFSGKSKAAQAATALLKEG